ncbi:hypothetical protein QA645_36710 [Bradyrhizobium sp. CIAT3101]|uniref:hypothetical protein n=1 Tax=Bradyrhizobium sp. CIAT3101 TaxID=439387 RepID=UPI0024B19373|nr:hypothetical protein [Bradyrhizobium sp. CIAT3101]WFU79982.1 hypothetical protein QA645_36710 [Bradyrhizobium sp. CIAT3101]
MTVDQIKSGLKCDFKQGGDYNPVAVGFLCQLHANQSVQIDVGITSSKLLAVSTTVRIDGPVSRENLFHQICEKFAISCPAKMTGVPYEIGGMGGTKTEISTTNFKDEFDLGDGLTLTILSPEPDRFLVWFFSKPMLEEEKRAVAKRNAPPPARF